MTATVCLQNDYLDCYGKDKGGPSDIERNKCTWLSVQALQRANPHQYQVLKVNIYSPRL